MRLLTVLGAVLLACGLFVVAALFDVALDVEENTRASFRVQQMVLEALQGGRPRRRPPADEELAHGTRGAIDDRRQVQLARRVAP